jgi:hypothetical protein
MRTSPTVRVTICAVDAKIGNLGPSGDLISDLPRMKIKAHVHFQGLQAIHSNLLVYEQ